MLSKISKKNTRGAFELSISTVIIIAIGATLLILGLVLVRNVFSGATGSIDLIDRNVKSQINQLFNEDSRKTVVYLPDNEARVEKGKSYNIEFAIKNVVRGESEAGKFTYSTQVSEVEQGCTGLSIDKAERFITLGRASSSPIPILPGDEPVSRTIKITPSEDSPLCSITYDIIVKKDGLEYDTNYFILSIEG